MFLEVCSCEFCIDHCGLGVVYWNWRAVAPITVGIGGTRRMEPVEGC